MGALINPFWGVTPPVLETPLYIDNGGITASASGSVNVPYPATVNAGELLVIYSYEDSGSFFTLPSGWTLIAQQQIPVAIKTTYLICKIATGSESGTLFLDSNSSSTVAAVMYRFSGVIGTGTPFEQTTIGQNPTPASTITLNANFLTLGNLRLSIGCFGVQDDTVNGTILNGWTEESILTTSVGVGVSLVLVTKQMPLINEAAGIVQATMSESEIGGVSGVYLIPE